MSERKPSAPPSRTVLTGPAGTGKTQFLLEEFARLLRESPDPFRRDVLYLLPSAEHRERIVDLMLRKDLKGFFGERVTTFNRLMQELLKGGDGPFVTDAERQFLLREIVTEKAGDYFQAVRGLPGFLETVGDFIGELKDSLLSVADFEHINLQPLEAINQSSAPILDQNALKIEP